MYSHRFFLYFPPNLACPSKSSVFVRVLAINFHMIRRKPWLSVRFFVGLLLKRLRSFSRLRSSRLSVNPFESEYLLLNVDLFQTLFLVSLKTIFSLCLNTKNTHFYTITFYRFLVFSCETSNNLYVCGFAFELK